MQYHISMRQLNLLWIYNKSIYKPSNYVSVPETIREYPSIRSMKSINNLDEMEEAYYKTRTKKQVSNGIYCNIVGMITLVLTYYGLYVS